jgi:hypothetical protein
MDNVQSSAVYFKYGFPKRYKEMLVFLRNKGHIREVHIFPQTTEGFENVKLEDISYQAELLS